MKTGMTAAIGVALALGLGMGVASGAAADSATKQTAVPVSHVGFVPADSDPENTPCGDFDTIGVAWDYGKRSLVVDVGKPRRVSSIIVTSSLTPVRDPQLKAETVGTR